MAETSCASASSDEQELIDIRNIIWGPNIRLDVFRRWSQGKWKKVHFTQNYSKLQQPTRMPINYESNIHPY